ncbi:MAG TPA: hypothetical protein VIC85_16330 [Ktedonobacterales bacterium]|jgi:hypothetical protein
MPTYTATALPARRARTPLNWRAVLLCLALVPSVWIDLATRAPAHNWLASFHVAALIPCDAMPFPC